MHSTSLQRSFLFRASTLLIVLLSLWWFALRGPMLLLLYAGVEIPFSFRRNASVKIEPSGEWSFRIPVQDAPADILRKNGAAKIDSIDFTVPGDDVATFTLGLPGYLAVALAIPGRRWTGRLMWGSIVQLTIGVVSTLLFAEVTAYNSLSQMRPDSGALGIWARSVAHHMLTAVVPYAAPVIAAVWLHPELGRAIFSPPPST
ncbi:MAG: hypothetical protein H7039_04745 [Bryobacteraceae bacterium]|nr:hypothetical protein [Bryobacteraceae bacterium]